MDLFGKMNFGEECKQWDSEADLVESGAVCAGVQEAEHS